MDNKIKRNELGEFLLRSQEEVKTRVIEQIADSKEISNTCNAVSVYEKLLEYAEENDMSVIHIKNIDTFVRGVGCSHCAICTIERLRAEGIAIYFVENQFSTFNKDTDLQLGAELERSSQEFQREVFMQIVEKEKGINS